MSLKGMEITARAGNGAGGAQAVGGVITLISRSCAVLVCDSCQQLLARTLNRFCAGLQNLLIHCSMWSLLHIAWPGSHTNRKPERETCNSVGSPA